MNNYLKRKKVNILLFFLVFTLFFMVGCDSGDSNSSQSQEYSVEITGVKDVQDIEAFTVAYDGENFLDFKEDNYNAETETLSAVVSSSKGEFELEIDNSKLS